MLFTDIVGSTRLKQDLGNRVAVELIQRHHVVVRDLLAQFAGAEEIDTAGDSFFIDAYKIVRLRGQSPRVFEAILR